MQCKPSFCDCSCSVNLKGEFLWTRHQFSEDIIPRTSNLTHTTHCGFLWAHDDIHAPHLCQESWIYSTNGSSAATQVCELTHDAVCAVTLAEGQLCLLLFICLLIYASISRLRPLGPFISNECTIYAIRSLIWIKRLETDFVCQLNNVTNFLILWT